MSLLIKRAFIYFLFFRLLVMLFFLTCLAPPLDWECRRYCRCTQSLRPQKYGLHANVHRVLVGWYHRLHHSGFVVACTVKCTETPELGYNVIMMFWFNTCKVCFRPVEFSITSDYYGRYCRHLSYICLWYCFTSLPSTIDLTFKKRCPVLQTQ